MRHFSSVAVYPPPLQRLRLPLNHTGNGMLTRTSRSLATLALTLGLAACASAGGQSGGGTGGDPNLLAADDLTDVQQLDANAAIQRLRPRWLRGRAGSQPNVIVDGAARSEGISALATIRVSEVEEMRFMNSNDATLRYGTGNTGGAIIITTKR